jgi:O-antigen/teichoic acid export membrane protein
MIVKSIFCILIFILIKSTDDLIIYIFLLAGSTLLSNVILWVLLPKFILLSKTNLFFSLKKHFFHILILFIPVIAVSLYKTMDKIMLGIMINYEEVAYYEEAEKVTMIVLSFIVAIGTVMLPRITNLFSSKKDKEAKVYIEKSFKLSSFLCGALIFGIAGVAKEFSPLFFGDGFEESGYIIQILSISLIFLAFSNILRTHYLLPKNRDNEFIISVIIGAFINIIANIYLIPIFEAKGAAMGTVLAEFTVCLVQILFLRKELPILHYIKLYIPYMTIGSFMFLLVYFYGELNSLSVFNLIIQIFIGALFYISFSFIYIYFFDKELLKYMNTIFKKLLNK